LSAMKKLLLIAALLLPLPAAAQLAAFNGQCILGGTPAKTSGLNSTNYLNGIIPSCTVTVYLTGTLTKATIYSNGSSGTLANPFTANTLNSVNPGGWLFYAAPGQGYDIAMSGGIAPNTYPAPVTLVDVEAGGGGGSCSGTSGYLAQFNSGGCIDSPLDNGITAASTVTDTGTAFQVITNPSDTWCPTYNFYTDAGQTKFCVSDEDGFVVNTYNGGNVEWNDNNGNANFSAHMGNYSFNAETGGFVVDAADFIYLDGGGLQLSANTLPFKTSPVSLSDSCPIICLFDTSLNAITVNLPSANTGTSPINPGQVWILEKILSAGANAVTIVPYGAETINGASSYTLSANYQYVILTAVENPGEGFTGGWYVVGAGPSSGSGTVTSVTVTGANGIGTSGCTITTSGTCALSLGAITPSSVVTGNLTNSALNPGYIPSAGTGGLLGNSLIDENQTTSGYDTVHNNLKVAGTGPSLVQPGTNLFSALPTCNSGQEGSIAPVTDSTTNTWGATITGSGSDHVLAYCDSANWTVMGK
jgi:hypothetical protein